MKSSNIVISAAAAISMASALGLVYAQSTYSDPQTGTPASTSQGATTTPSQDASSMPSQESSTTSQESSTMSQESTTGTSRSDSMRVARADRN